MTRIATVAIACLSLLGPGCAGWMPRDSPVRIDADACARMPCVPAIEQDDALQPARAWHRLASRESGQRAQAAWLRCAGLAHDVAARSVHPQAALALSTRCTRRLLSAWPARRAITATPTEAGVDGLPLRIDLRDASPYLRAPVRLHPASAPDMRHGEGFGVPVVLASARCDDAPVCDLLPPEGVFRDATAWIEPDDTGEGPHARLVVADPFVHATAQVGPHAVPLARDATAAYGHAARRTKLPRLAIWGLLGGHEVGRRAGLYLLEDYDPDKQPLLMIHGLGSSPLAWRSISDAVWSDPRLRARYQVWHLVYQTNAPLLVTRRRIHGYLDAAWRALDPEGDDPARSGMVVIGHSMGGVLARLLCVDSGDALWNAAFVLPPTRLRGSATDLAVVNDTFRFAPYPGIARAVFIAAPHRGSPNATHGFGRLARVLVGRRAMEMQSLRRIAIDNPDAVRPALLPIYRRAQLNSISTLQTTQPVRQAGESLMPARGIPYHTIAGALPGRQPPGDGVVPLDSALLDGAASTLVVASGHDLYAHPQAVAEVMRILGQ